MAIVGSVLVVDDDRQIHRLLKLGLAACNIETSAAMTASEALVLVTEQKFDLVILDIGLPDRDGFECLTEIRKASKIPVVICSVRNDRTSKVKAFNLGADDYVTKPFSMPELVARIHTALRHRTQTPD